jgi:subtilisin family serine protease
MRTQAHLFRILGIAIGPALACAQTAPPPALQAKTLSLNIAPVKDAKSRAQLWDAIEATGQLVSLTVAASQTPQDAVTAKCGAAHGDLMDKVYSLNPGVVRGAVDTARELRTIPCPYWYVGTGRRRPSIPVRIGESIEPILRQYLGTATKSDLARVVKLNPGLIDAGAGNVTSDGKLVLPYVAKPLTLTVATPQTEQSAATAVKAIVESLPPPARPQVRVSLSPDEYQLVAIDDPALADPAQQCGGPKADTDWPYDLASLQIAFSATKGAASSADFQNVVVVADTGVRLADTAVSDRLWRNLPLLSNLPGPVANYRNDLHGASMVTRKGDPIDIEPDPLFVFGGHGTDVARIIVDPGVRVAALDRQMEIAIAKLVDQSTPFKISIASVPAAVNYARGIQASAINLSVVAGAIGSLEESLDASLALVVTAAGNNGDRPEVLGVFPPALASHREKLLVVGAHDWNNRITSFSNFGANVDILAPGCAIPIKAPDGTTRLVSGTSFAAPFVAYTAALLHAVHMPLRPAVLRNRIVASGRFEPALVNKTRYAVVLDIERTIRIKEDSYLPVGATVPVYGTVSLAQNWTCSSPSETRNFIPRKVLKLIPAYPSATPSVMVWSQPASDGPLLESLCAGTLQDPFLSFTPDGQTDVQKVPWASIQDVVMRVFPD